MMKRMLSFLLCLVMVLSFAAPAVQAADVNNIFVSSDNLDGIITGDNVKFENVVIDGNTTGTVTRPNGLVPEFKPDESPVLNLPVESETVCNCDECETIAEHTAGCTVKAEYHKICAVAGKDLVAQWAQYTADEQAYMLQYMQENMSSRYEEFMKLLNAPTGSDSLTYVDGTTVSVDGIPEDGSLTVKDAADEVKDIVDAYNAKQEDKTTPLFSYDVSVQDGEGADWQPETSVKMELEMPGVNLHKNTKVYVVHVDDNGVATTIEAAVTEDGKIAFETPGFSAFFGFTVDFEFEGAEYSIKGMSSILLSELFDNLGMPLNAEDVVNVEFTDYDLLSVEKLDGDWKLTSLKAFQTTETLTFTMDDGNVYKITVTDDVTSPATFKVGTSIGDSDNNGVATWNLNWQDNYYAGLNSNYNWDTCSGYANDLHNGYQAITISGGGNFELCLQGCKDNVIDTYYVWIHSITVTGGSTLNIRLGSCFDPGETIVIYGNDSYDVPMLEVDNGSLYFNIGADDADLLPQGVGFTASHANASDVKIVLDHKNRATGAYDPIVYVDNGVEGDGGEKLVMNNVTFRRGNYRGMLLHPNKMDLFQLRNCYFEDTVGCSKYGGGAIYIDKKTLSTGFEVNIHNMNLYNVTFDGNAAGGGDGGAATIYGNLDNTLFQGCTFDGNTATGKGGAVNIGNGTNTFGQGNITFSGCSFLSTESSGTYGGAVAIRDKVGNVSFNTCTFTTVTAKSHGGAVNISNDDKAIEVTSITFTNCDVQTATATGNRGGLMRLISSSSPNLTISGGTYNNCTATSPGGVISAQGTIGDILISGATFTNNSSGARGGAISVKCSTVGNITLSDSTFTGNKAGTLGGAVHIGIHSTASAPITAGDVSVSGCNFENNTANGVGGGLSLTDGTYNSITVQDSTFSGCTAANYGGAIGMKTYADDATEKFPFKVTGAVQILDCSFNGCIAGGLSPEPYDHDGDATTAMKDTWDHDGNPSTAEIIRLNGTGGGGAIAIGGEIGTGITIKSTKKDAATNKESYSKFTDCYTWNNGGAICITGTVKTPKVDMQYLDINGCRARDAGGAVHLSNCIVDNLHMYSCTIQNCSYFTEDFDIEIPAAYADLGKKTYAAYDASGTIRCIGNTTCQAKIEMCTINNNSSYSNGGGVYWNANNIRTGAAGTKITPSLTLLNSWFEGNTTLRDGGALYVEATVAVQDCVFTGNHADSRGGAIAQQVYNNEARQLGAGEATNLSLNVNTSIYGNSATNGGGISITVSDTVSATTSLVGYPVKFTLGGAKVYSNEATQHGGGIYYATTEYGEGTDAQKKVDNFNKEIIINNGAIYSNTAGYNSGDVKELGGNGGGIYMDSNQYTTVGSGYSKVTISNGSIYSNTATKGNGGGIYLTGKNALCTVTGGTIGGSSTYANKATAYDSGEIDATTGAAIYKEGNGGGIAIYGGARIEMTGGTISYNQAHVGGGIAVRDGSSMLSDKADDGTSGTISYNNATSAGGGVAVHDAGSTMTINLGTVSYNTAAYGGGISIMTSGDASTIGTDTEDWGMIFNDGTISNNLSSTLGGGVVLSDNATMKLTGGQITLNHAGTKTDKVDEKGNPIYTYTSGQEGGGIAVCQGSQMDVYSGTVDYNYAYNGGGIVIRGASTVNMYPVTEKDATTGEEVEKVGIIDHNTADRAAGGVYCYNSDLTMYGGTISNNTSNEGGGLYIENDDDGDSTVTIYGGLITMNTASTSGGGIFMIYSATKLYMYGGTISENTASSDGGGAYIGNNAYALISKYTNTTTGETIYPYITKNTGSSGGGIHVRWGADLEVNEGFITYNHAKGTGIKGNSQLTTAKGEINTGSNAGIGGGVYLGSSGSNATYRATFKLTGTNVGIYGNTAEFAADDVFSNGSNTKLTVLGVTLMNLAGYGYTPEGWFEDYAKNDTAYESGLNLAAITEGKTDIKNGNVWRYRFAAAGKRVLIDDENVEDRVNVANTYVCMTLGHAAAKDDTVVIDFGLPVKIDVVRNDVTIANQDFLHSGLLGYNKPQVDNVNTSSEDVFFGAKDSSYVSSPLNLTYGKAYLSNGYVVYQLDTSAMDMTAEDTFYYAVNPGQYYHYAKVTVIPATTLYYEDNVDAIIYDGAWETAGEELDLEDLKYAQDEDRPGEDKNNQLGDADADNVYGYDDIYGNQDKYSMQSASKVKVTAGHPASARFSFWGTGFDVVSLTSSTTGLIVVKVTDADNKPVVNYMVDTYYGYVFADTDNDGTPDSWVANDKATNTIYQVPVIKVDLLKAIKVPADDPSTPDVYETETKVPGYGYYNVEIVASYSSVFDHGQCDCTDGCKGCYDFYLDSIRIYNPAQDWVDNDVIKGTYLDDNEGWPSYKEIRNMLIDKNTFNSAGSTDINGAIFIDGYNKLDPDNNTGAEVEGDHLAGKHVYIADYANFGPNNEIYLAAGQGIAFALDSGAAKLPAGVKIASIQIGLKSAGGTSCVKIYDAEETTCADTEEKVLSSATDMYYEITSMDGGNVVIYCSSAFSCLTITNLKITYTGDPSAAAGTGETGDGYGDEVTTVDQIMVVNADVAESVLNSFVEEKNAPVLTPKYPSLSLEGEVHYNVYFTAENLGGLSADRLGLVTFKTQDTNGTVDTAVDVITGAEVSGGMYVVTTNGIPAKELGDTLYFKVFAQLEDGSYVYSDLRSYSALQYAESILKDSDDAELKALVVAMLNYGAEAQKFFGYNTDNLMNKSVTAEQQALLAAYSAVALNTTEAVDEAKVGNFVSNGGFTKKYPSVSLEGAFQINYYFVPEHAVEDGVIFYYWNEETYNSAAELTADNADGVISMSVVDGVYTASSSQIAAKDIEKTVYAAAVYVSEGTTYCTGVLPYSLAAYCESYATDTTSDAAAVANAMAIYGNAAKVFFGA